MEQVEIYFSRALLQRNVDCQLLLPLSCVRGRWRAGVWEVQGGPILFTRMSEN